MTDKTSSDEASTNPGVPDSGALLGIDYGTKRLGIAICNEEQTLAVPLENYDLSVPHIDGPWLRQTARGYGCVGLVVGLPVHMSGDEGGKAREAREFGKWAAEATGLPVTWWDERFSSATADMHLDETGFTKKRRKARRDKIAAQVILQSFIDSDDRTAAPIAFD